VDQAPDTTSLRDYLETLRRSKWLISGVMLLSLAAAVAVSLLQTPLYQGTADVLTTQESIARDVAESPTATPVDPTRYAETQASLARSPTVIRRVLESAGRTRESVDSFLSRSEVQVKPETDVLEFSVKDEDGAVAAALAKGYARQFIRYRRELDTDALERARRGVEEQLGLLGSDSEGGDAAVANLLQARQELATLEALQSTNAVLVGARNEATQVRPRVDLNLALGLGFGVHVSVFLAYVREAFNRTLREP